MGQIDPDATGNGPNDPNDQLPSYEDVINPAHQSHNEIRSPPSDHVVPGARSYHSIYPRKRQSGIVTLSPVLAQNHGELHQLLTQQASAPPRPCLRVEGHRTEIQRDAQGTKRKPVTDFDFKLDLTRGLFPCADPGDWSELHVVRDGDNQKAFRGGRWPSRSRRETKPKGRVDLEQADQTLLGSADELSEDNLALMGWCERFCGDPARVKSFTFTRALHGFNSHPMRTVLASRLRAANYPGEVKVSTSLANESITIYSPHWINRLRNNWFVFWACFILQLWIVAWPVIWLLERRYEVVRSTWWSSRECTPSSGQRVLYPGGYDETALAEYWAPAVKQGAHCRVHEGTPLPEYYAEQLRQSGLRSMGSLFMDDPLSRNVMMADSVTGGMFGRLGRAGGLQRLDFGWGNSNFSMAWGNR